MHGTGHLASHAHVYGRLHCCQVDEYPLGTNAVVAVISYTGFDMEDAMILVRVVVARRGFSADSDGIKHIVSNGTIRALSEHNTPSRTILYYQI